VVDEFDEGDECDEMMSAFVRPCARMTFIMGDFLDPYLPHQNLAVLYQTLPKAVRVSSSYKMQAIRSQQQ